MNIILLGPPGAGKGTIAGVIKQDYPFDHISTGDMLREQIAQKTELGLAAKRYIDQGALVPDDVVIGMVQQRVAQSQGAMLDGFPRTVDQARALDKILQVDAAILLTVPVETVLKRLSGRRVCRDCKAVFNVSTYAGDKCDKCGGELYTRDDDKEDTIRERYEVYMQKTQPVADYYKEKGILFTIDGEAGLDAEKQEIYKIIEGLK